MASIRKREELLGFERDYLVPGATSSSDARLTQREFAQEPDDFRTEFERDYTRIIHSRAFRRLRHKTQVFISPRNDHLCTRLEHSLHVASIATTIAQGMGLNASLVRATAVGHDLGHAPFGHEGERILDEIARVRGLRFSHELHGMRVVDRLDSPYRGHVGLNLTFAVRDGIACHYGEGFERDLKPSRRKKPESLISMKRGRARPATLEGCVVRWSDKIAYLGRDLEDALMLGLLQKRQVPKVVRERLGVTNRSVINALITDLLEHSTDQVLSVSAQIHRALNFLYTFNMNRIYRSGKATASHAQVRRAMKPLFELIEEKIAGFQKSGRLPPRPSQEQRRESVATVDVLTDFLRKDVRNWRQEKPARLALDFVAGMTDSFFVATVNELFFPRGVS